MCLCFNEHIHTHIIKRAIPISPIVSFHLLYGNWSSSLGIRRRSWFDHVHSDGLFMLKKSRTIRSPGSQHFGGKVFLKHHLGNYEDCLAGKSKTFKRLLCMQNMSAAFEYNWHFIYPCGSMAHQCVDIQISLWLGWPNSTLLWSCGNGLWSSCYFSAVVELNNCTLEAQVPLPNKQGVLTIHPTSVSSTHQQCQHQHQPSWSLWSLPFFKLHLHHLIF